MKNAGDRRSETELIKASMIEEEKNTLSQEEQVSHELANIQVYYFNSASC